MIPTLDGVLADYLAQHAGTLSVATLARRVASISKAHAEKGLSQPGPVRAGQVDAEAYQARQRPQPWPFLDSDQC